MKHKGKKTDKVAASAKKTDKKPASALAQLAQKQRAILLKGNNKSSPSVARPVVPSSKSALPSALATSNPFDKFANARKKHEVVNRRVKGEDRNVGRARDKAVEDRKKRLLQDYNSSKKSNSFQDKRFGEQDATMSLEEKMFMRFQKERLKKARNSSIFNLDSGDHGEEDQLTHKGKILGDGANYDEEDFDKDEDDDNLGRDVVNNLHFGGGLVPKSSSSSYGPASERGEDAIHDISPRSRLDALQEIVMKSKLHKLEKKEAKEEQEDTRVELDKAFQDLIAGSMVQFRPVRGDRSEDAPLVNDAFSDYDKALAAMAYEAKAQASDRTKTTEELAVEEREKLEEAEAARKKRMRGVVEAVGGKEAAEALKSTKAKGGKAGKAAGKNAENGAKRRRTDDDLDDDSPVYADGDIVTNNYGWADEEEDEEDEGAGDEDNEDDEDDEEEEDDVDSDHPSDEVDDEDEDDEPVQPHRASRKLPTNDNTLNDAMPHILPCPASPEELDELIEQYVLSSADYYALLSRVTTYHSVHLPAPQGPQNRILMNGFLDILLKVFIRVGDALCTEGQAGEGLLLLTDLVSATSSEVKALLDKLSGLVHKLCLDLPEVAPVIWGKILRQFQQQLQNRLREYQQGTRSTCWPSLGRLLLLKLLGKVFSVTDYRHALVTPASILLSQYLSQCPVTSGSDILSGMLTSAVLLGYTQETARLVPEATEFVRQVISLYQAPAQEIEKNASSRIRAGTFDLTKLGALREAAASLHEWDEEYSQISWRYFHPRQGGQGAGFTPDLARSILGACFNVSNVVLTRHAECSALPELLTPLLEALQKLRPDAKPSVPRSLCQEHKLLLESVGNNIHGIKATRRPLQWRVIERRLLESKAPKFQLDYTFKKDTDPDADRAKMKQLTRQLKREQKAAMRELRRDGEFLDRESFREKSEAAETRRNERAKNFAFMEEQQANINLQVRKGGSLMKGGGSSVVPKQVRSKEAKRRKGR